MRPVAELQRDLDAALAELPAADLPALIGACAQTQAKALARLTTPAAAPPSPPMSTIDATAGEIAARFKVARSFVYELARRGKIPCRRIGERYVRFNIEAVEAALSDATKIRDPGTRGGPRKKSRRNISGLPAGSATNATSLQPLPQPGGTR